MAIINDTVRVRFFSKLEVSTEHTHNGTSCWIWNAAMNAQGYGVFRFMQKSYLAHRFAFLKLSGREIRDGLELDHLCRRSKCVNPDHLEPVTHAENLRRTRGTRKGITENWQKAKTHCKKGHEYTAQNTLIHHRANRAPSRECRECNRLRCLGRYANCQLLNS